MDEEDSMKCDKNFCQGAALLLIAITVLLAPGAGAQNQYKTLHRFKGGKDGEFMYAGLVFDQNGNLYGATTGGGAGGNGTVFKLTPQADGSWTKSVLYSFTSSGTDGANPYASLIFDQKGNLYGTTVYGGAQGSGAVFKLAPKADGSWTENVIYSFLGGKDGGNPSASLIFDQKGNLYGTTQDGGNGAPGNGTAFKLAPNADGSWTESVLHVFSGGEDGGNPTASLIVDPAGNLYGTTFYGGGGGSCPGGECGLVFELMPNADGTWTESVLYSFTGGTDGGNPETDLIFDPAGNMYGTTKWGGKCTFSDGCGVVFELTPNKDGSWMESVVNSFGGRDGFGPTAGLVFDAAGNLYGTTVLGGDRSLCNKSSGCGVVFKLTPNSNGKWTETVLHRFLARPGSLPYAGLVFDASGNLYGTTFGDIKSTLGSVFEVTR
jgi:uncharacterized repeat protein (TIGR03803 family)